MSALTDKDRAAVSQSLRHAKLVAVSRRLARIVRHVDPDPKTKRKRARIEKSLDKWLRYFGGEAFSSPWSADHLRVLTKIESAINGGGLFSVAMPRGQGKSTILKWVTLYVLLTGRRKYVVLIAATLDLALGMIDFCKRQLIENDLLHDYYPHVTAYARATEDKAIKARQQLRADGADGTTSGIQWRKATLVLPAVCDAAGNGYVSNGSILEAHGLTGAIRGKWKDTQTGAVLRPDFVILDDPQTRESAESSSQCQMRERIVKGDVLGMAGPKKKIAAVMPCTVIRKGDLADRFLDHEQHPEWQGEKTRLVNAWPKEQDGLWREYAGIYRASVGSGGGITLATQFYVAHRDAMDEGADVAWAHRVRDGEISALQTAENLLIEMGAEAFYAEMQNDPQENLSNQYDLTPATVLAHVVARPRLQLPEASTVFVGHCDVNHYGLHYVLSAFSQDMTGHCVAYGRFPERGVVVEEKNTPEMEICRAIYRALKGLCDTLQATVFFRGGIRAKLGLLLIDCGYKADAVQQFCQQAQYSFRLLPSIGRDAKNYRVKKDTLIGRPFENCHVQRAQKPGHGPYLMFQSDYWRETAQRAFLGAVGEPGGYTIHAAGDQRQHMTLAEHVCAERLSNKYQTDQGPRWEWVHSPGSQWDLGDALTGSWVAAAASGLSVGGLTFRRKQYVETRKAKVMPE